MLKYIEYVTAAAILLGVAGLFALMFLYGSPSSKSQVPEHQRNEALESRSDAGSPQRTLWEKARTDPIALFTFWLVVFTAVLSGVGVIQLKFLRRAEAIAANTAQAATNSAIAAKQSAEIAEKTLIVANRPWIKVDVRPGPIFYNVNGANFTFTFLLKNIGKSPATHVSVDLKVLLSYPSDQPRPSGLNASQLLREEISEKKKRPPSPFGSSVFPDETLVQEITTSVPPEEIDRATKLIKAIYPTVYGSVEYRMGLDTTPHHTGFIFDVQRDGQPRPFTTQGKKSPTAIWTEEGDVRLEDVRLLRSFLEGGYAD